MVMLIPITIFLFFIASVRGKVCESKQYWSSETAQCEQCTDCTPPDLAIRPCQGHRDTTCGPLSELKIDWSWLKKQNHQENQKKLKNMADTFKENIKFITLHEKYVKEKEARLRKQNILNDESPQENWRPFKKLSKNSDISDDLTAIEKQNQPLIPFDLESGHVLHFDSKEAQELLKNINKSPNALPMPDFEFNKSEPETYEKVVHLDDDFSSAEQFVLDWQTIILALAVAACVTFFLVALAYALMQLPHWRMLRNHFVADKEQLKSWISPKKSKCPPKSGIYKTTTEVIHNENGHRKYLERIINKNAKQPKIVYGMFMRPMVEELKPLNEPTFNKV